MENPSFRVADEFQLAYLGIQGGVATNDVRGYKMSMLEYIMTISYSSQPNSA
jgi:hypothetical protein